MKEINCDNTTENVQGHQRLVACVQKLGELREYTESSVNAIGSLKAEETLVKNVPALEVIVYGNLKSAGKDNQLGVRVASLPTEVVNQTQDQIDLLFGTMLTVGAFASARRLDPYLPITIPETKAGFTTLKLIAQQFTQAIPIPDANGLSNVSQMAWVLDKLDRRLKVVGLNNEDVVDALSIPAKEQAQTRLERFKQDEPDRIRQVRSMIAQQKVSSFKREPVELPGPHGYSRFEILVNQIIEEENLTAQVDSARARAKEMADEAREVTLSAIAKKRAIGTVIGLIDQDQLLCQEMARRQRMNPEDLLVADNATKRLAANNILNSKKVVLSVEERRIFYSHIVIAEEREKLTQALQDPLIFIATLSDDELTVIRHGIPKISDAKSVYVLAGERLREQLEDEVTDEEMAMYLTKVIVSEILSARITGAIDQVIAAQGFDRGLILANPNILLNSAEAIVSGALKFLTVQGGTTSPRDATAAAAVTDLNRKDTGRAFINIRQAATEGLDSSPKIVIAGSEINFINADTQKTTRRIKAILEACIDRGVLAPTLGGGESLPSALIHTLTGMGFVNLDLADYGNRFIHARVLAQNSQGKYGWTGAEPITDLPKISVLSGPCLFGASAVRAIDSEGSVHSLADPFSSEISQPIDRIEVNKKLQPYEADAILRLTSVISSLNRDKNVEVNLNIPRIEYWFYALDAYEKGLIGQKTLFTWFNEVEQRAAGIARLITKRLPREFNIVECSPLLPTEAFVRQSISDQRRNLMPGLIEILNHDHVWAHAIEVTKPSGFQDLSYLGYCIPYLKKSAEPDSLLVVIENPEETTISDQARPLMDGFVNDGVFVGLYPHSNVALAEDPDFGGGRRMLYFFNPNGSVLTPLKDVIGMNKII